MSTEEPKACPACLGSGGTSPVPSLFNRICGKCLGSGKVAPAFVITEEDLELAKKLVAEGWRSTSNRFHMIARIPPGMTLLEALEKYAPTLYRDTLQRVLEQCTSQFLRCYSSQVEGCHQELTLSQYKAFRQAGGSSA